MLIFVAIYNKVLAKDVAQEKYKDKLELLVRSTGHKPENLHRSIHPLEEHINNWVKEKNFFQLNIKEQRNLLQGIAKQASKISQAIFI